MAKSRAEIQKAYRERRKVQDPGFLVKERQRQRQYYVPAAKLLEEKSLHQERIESASNQLNDMESQIADLMDENDVLRKERDEIKVRMQKHLERLESARSQLNDMEQSLTSCQDDLETTELHMKVLESKVFDLESTNTALMEVNKSLMSKLERQ